MNRKETICSGIKNGKRCPNVISNEAVFCLDCGSTNTDNVSAQSFCEWDNKNTEESDTSESQDDDNGNEKWDFNELLNTSHAIDVSTNTSSKRCKNCRHTIQQDQMFCDKCGNKLGAVCIGEINGKPCSKFISVETKFCAHCGTANIDNSSGNKKAPLKRSCKSCGHDVHKHQKFCNNCGYKIGAHCLGKVKGNPCNEFLNMEIKFCANCGNHNPDYLTEEIKDSDEERPACEEIKDSDEERPACGEISTSNASSENLEEAFLEIESKGSIITDVLNRLKTDGVIATREYLTEQVTKWKRAKVKFAVAGQSTAGKSAFINAIRGVKHNHEGYAKEGFGNTTLKIKEYVHPNNKQIIYCDLPGYGTTTITRDTFLAKVNTSEYDMFIIFFTSVPTTDDEWLVKQLREANIPVCFVRTKLDQDIENGKQMGKSKLEVLADIKNTIASATKTMQILKDEQMFIISNRKPYLGDMSKLVNFMQERVTKIKCEAILFSIPAFTADIIESKYQELLRRMPIVILTRAFVYNPLFTSINEIFMDEIRMYFRVFELDTGYATKVPGLKHYFNDAYVRKLIDDLKEKTPCRNIQFIPIYSTIKNYNIWNKYLTNLLDELKIDANIMSVHITKTV